MLVEGSKVLVGRPYEEARNMGVLRVEQVQRVLSVAQTVPLRHGGTAPWPRQARGAQGELPYGPGDATRVAASVCG